MSELNESPQRSYIWWILVAVVALVVTLFLVIPRGNTEQGEIVIGAVLPLSGSAAPYGKNAREGIELALDHLRDGKLDLGVELPEIRVIYEDSRTEATEGVAALRKLHEVDKVSMIIGDINSTGVLAMADYANQNKILLLSPGASNPKISEAGPFVFRNWHSDALEGEFAAGYASTDLKWKKAAILYVTEAYGTGLATVFRDRFGELGGNVVAFEGYPQDVADLRDQVRKIIDTKPDGLYLPGWPNEMALALRQLRQAGSDLPVLSAQGFNDPQILQLAGEAAEGAQFTAPAEPDPTDPITRLFREGYKEKYGEEPGVCSDSGYDALRLLVGGVIENGASSGDIRAYLNGVNEFPGAAGPLSFDENGDLEKPIKVYEVKDGQFR